MGPCRQHQGSTITLGASWDVWDHGHSDIELYGEAGSMFLPDPDFFGGTPRLTNQTGQAKKLVSFPHPFGNVNERGSNNERANYRGAGLADMARAIIEGEPHRCSLELSLHVVDVMTSILKSGENGQFIELSTTCERPAPLGIGQAEMLLSNRQKPSE